MFPPLFPPPCSYPAIVAFTQTSGGGEVTGDPRDATGDGRPRRLGAVRADASIITKTTAQATSATQKAARATPDRNPRPVTSPNSTVAALYIPRGNTNVHSWGVYTGRSRRRTCRQNPNTR